MRQLLSLLLALLAMTALQANELRHVGGFTERAEHASCALDRDFNAFPCDWTIVNDTDVMFTILDENMSTLKQFTIKNAWKEDEDGRWINSPEDLRANLYFGLYRYDSNCLLTQTFFNDDDKWEVVIRENRGKKYSIYNEDGERIGNAPCIIEPDDDDPSMELMQFVLVKNIAYFYNWYDAQFYTYNQNVGNTVAELPAAAAKAYPNPLRHGETLTIEMENGPDGTYKVEVVDMKGAKLFSAEKEAKNGVIKVPSVRLHKGWNVYTVKEGDEIIEKGKILVK